MTATGFEPMTITITYNIYLILKYSHYGIYHRGKLLELGTVKVCVTGSNPGNGKFFSSMFFLSLCGILADILAS